jgi:hypothetical protein
MVIPLFINFAIQLFWTPSLIAGRLPNYPAASAAFSWPYESERKNGCVNAGQCAFREQRESGKRRPAQPPPFQQNRTEFFGEGESGRCAAAFFVGAHLMAVALQVTVEAGAADSKDLRRAQAIPLA